jgi:predicted nucleic acid-binding protein
MIVVADSGPLHYLILLDHSELLRRFYSRVVVPDAVAANCPPPVRLRQCATGSSNRHHGSV